MQALKKQINNNAHAICINIYTIIHNSPRLLASVNVLKKLNETCSIVVVMGCNNKVVNPWKYPPNPVTCRAELLPTRGINR